jgi:STE24 endopeptidase
MATVETQPALDLEPTSPEVKRYQKQKLTAALAKTLLGLAFLAVMGIWLGPKLGSWLTEALGDRDWLRLLFVAAVVGIGMEALTWPIAFWSGFVLEHRYQLSNQTLSAWIWRRIKGYLVGGVIGLILLFGLYAILWWAGDWWWLWAAGGGLLVTLILGQLVPVLILPLFYKVTPLNDSGLLDRLQRLAQGTGLTVAGVFRLHLSQETRK